MWMMWTWNLLQILLFYAFLNTWFTLGTNWGKAGPLIWAHTQAFSMIDVVSGLQCRWFYEGHSFDLTIENQASSIFIGSINCVEEAFSINEDYDGTCFALSTFSAFPAKLKPGNPRALPSVLIVGFHRLQKFTVFATFGRNGLRTRP